MVENIRLKIVDSQEEILDAVYKNVGTLVNFDCRADYPMYEEKIFDADSYSSMISEHYPKWLDNNWVPVLVSKGYMGQYIWLYPHDCGKDDIKIFESKKGDCLIYNVKFNGRTKVPYKFITIDMSFIGCKVPINWSPNDREGLFMSVIECLTARNVMMVISKSKRYVNYDVDIFLDSVVQDIQSRVDIEMI